MDRMELRATAPRRLIGVTAMTGLGVMLLVIAFRAPGAPVWQVVLGLFGLAALWGAKVMWEATSHALILTDDALVDSDGTVVAPFDQIAKVDRSPFAMKPSNGFLLILKEPAPRVWRPGLWWRWGRRVAVGGVTAGAHTKPMADMIAMKLAGGPPLDFK